MHNNLHNIQVNRGQVILILISAMKGITKDHQSIAKDYESYFYSMKDQCKKIFALHLRPYITILQYWLRVSCVYQTLPTLFHIEGAQVFQKGATSRPFETT